MFHYTNIPKISVSDQSSDCEEGLKECLGDIDVQEVKYIDDPGDPDVIEIVITGRFKKDAFKRKSKTKDNFDDARPF